MSAGGNGSGLHNNNNNSPSSGAGHNYANKRAVAFGKHFQLPTALRAASKRSSSAPNLGEMPANHKEFVTLFFFIDIVFLTSRCLATEQKTGLSNFSLQMKVA